MLSLPVYSPVSIGTILAELLRFPFCFPCKILFFDTSVQIRYGICISSLNTQGAGSVLNYSCRSFNLLLLVLLQFPDRSFYYTNRSFFAVSLKLFLTPSIAGGFSLQKNGCAGNCSGTAVFGILLNQQVDQGDDKGAVGSLVEQENDQSEQNDPVLIDVEILQDLIDWSLIPSLL